MRSALPGCVLTLLAASVLPSCSDDPCQAANCSPAPAMAVSITGPGGGPVAGAFVEVAIDGQMVRVECRDESVLSLCLLGGGTGSHQLRIGAPGHVTVQREVVVEARDEGCCGTMPATTRVEVVLEPAPAAQGARSSQGGEGGSG